MDSVTAKKEILRAGNDLVKLGLVARTWGNVSCRIDEKNFAITPSGIGYDRLDEDKIVVVDIDTLKYDGSIKPSSEKGIHASAYRVDSNINFVIHTHQTYATCISVSGFSKLAPTQDELTLLDGGIGQAAYGLPGSASLMKKVTHELVRRKYAILMTNHGALLTGTNRDETFKRSSLLEGICHRAMNDLPDFNDSPGIPDQKTGDIITSIRREYPEYKCVMLLDSNVVKTAMEKTDAIPAIIDDFAQIVGSDARVVDEAIAQDTIKGLKGRNAVCIKGIGALCCAGDESDCRAIMTLVEKNTLAYINAKYNGDSPGLSFFDKKLMRYFYIKKYSKNK